MITRPPPVEIHEEEFRALISSYVPSEEGEASSEPASPGKPGMGLHTLMSRVRSSNVFPPSPEMLGAEGATETCPDGQKHFRTVLFRPQITCQIDQRDLRSEKFDDLGFFWRNK
ncbi:hypothetical protein J6590_048011 [Homalodisca vitripennis]|nr:hypothetical protein J6590_048011 [Homalodisca vitripennis]